MALILVIDDDPAIRAALVRVLEKDSHAVEVCSDGRAALEAVGRARPDVIITDIYMPEMDGIEFLLSLRVAEPDLPVIVTSGGGMASVERVLADASDLGATATLAKPFDVDEVLELVRSLLEAGGG